jgi:hypothetical protein
MSPRPVLGGAAPVAPDAPAPHVLRARVVDRDRPALLASGSAHPGGSGEKRPIPARTAVVLGDDATSGADVQTNLLSPGRRADRRVMAGYDGPVVDAFLHTPWLGGDDRADPRDDVDWHGDPRLARVMHRKETWPHRPPGAKNSSLKRTATNK